MDSSSLIHVTVNGAVCDGPQSGTRAYALEPFGATSDLQLVEYCGEERRPQSLLLRVAANGGYEMIIFDREMRTEVGRNAFVSRKEAIGTSVFLASQGLLETIEFPIAV